MIKRIKQYEQYWLDWDDTTNEYVLGKYNRNITYAIIAYAKLDIFRWRVYSFGYEKEVGRYFTRCSTEKALWELAEELIEQHK